MGSEKKSRKRTKSQKKSGMHKKSYEDMIVDCIITLHERMGSSPQAIWKAMQNKYPESLQNQMRIRIKALVKDNVLKRVKGKLRLDPDYAKKLLKKEKMKGKKVRKTKAT